MSELPAFLLAVQRVAKAKPGGDAEVRKLLEEKFVLPGLAAAKTVVEASLYREQFGEVGFRELLHQLAEAKLRGLVRRLDKHAISLTAETPLSEVRRHAEGLASGAIAPTSKAPSRPKPMAVDVPDLRAVYRSGGNDAVFKIIAGLDAKQLKAVSEAQQLRADIKPKGADGWKKFIQVALKAELGSGADPIGKLSAMPTEESED